MHTTRTTDDISRARILTHTKKLPWYSISRIIVARRGVRCSNNFAPRNALLPITNWTREQKNSTHQSLSFPWGFRGWYNLERDESGRTARSAEAFLGKVNVGQLHTMATTDCTVSCGRASTLLLRTHVRGFSLASSLYPQNTSPVVRARPLIKSYIFFFCSALITVLPRLSSQFHISFRRVHEKFANLAN